MVEEVDRNDGEGLPVHSQVIRIKKEIERIKHPSLQLLQMRLRDVNRLRSRSPLGLGGEGAILVGHS